MSRSFIAGILLWLWAGACAADLELKPFVAGSLDEITQQHEGQAFVMVLWSKDCPPCLRELAQIRELSAEIKVANLVLVSTDDMMAGDQVESLLREYGLQGLDNWIFGDAIIERSRYRVDSEWYGELPRTYFYDASHRRQSHSGMLDKIKLKKWLQANGTLTISNMEP